MADILEATHRGHFGYEELNGNLIIPCIFRGTQKFCATKVLLWYFKQHTGLKDLSEYSTDFRYLKGFQMHRDEIYLWNEINHWHNGSMYPFDFVYNDTLCNIEDVRDIFNYLDDCKQKLTLHAKTDASSIALFWWPANDHEEVMLPLVSSNGQRYVPTSMLQFLKLPQTLSSITMTGINVMYMRFLFEVLKIDKPTESSEMPCTNFDELVAYLNSSDSGYFGYTDDFWPSKKRPEVAVNNENLPFFTTNQNSNKQNLQTTKVILRAQQIRLNYFPRRLRQSK